LALERQKKNQETGNRLLEKRKRARGQVRSRTIVGRRGIGSTRLGGGCELEQGALNASTVEYRAWGGQAECGALTFGGGNREWILRKRKGVVVSPRSDWRRVCRRKVSSYERACSLDREV